MTVYVRDLLETVYDPKSGTHAAYPTAEKTLCGAARESMEPLPGFGAPMCAPCVNMARVCRRVDRSAPADWLFELPSPASRSERSNTLR